MGSSAGEVFSDLFRHAINDAINVQQLAGNALDNFQALTAAGLTLVAGGVNGITQGIGAMTEAILNGEDGWKAFGNTMLKVLKQVIVQLVEAAALAAILSAISGGAAGGGISFAKQFLKLLGGGGSPGFATGGFVVPAGFPNDGYNARLSSGEVVLPLNRIGDFLNTDTSGQVIVLNSRLRGSDMILQQSRTNRSQRRTG
jgi:hypothetical protein